MQHLDWCAQIKVERKVGSQYAKDFLNCILWYPCKLVPKGSELGVYYYYESIIAVWKQ